MQIKESDFLWNCYQRAYSNEAVPRPTNLCSYFWTSMCGLLYKVYWDYNIIAMSILFAIGLYGAFYPLAMMEDSPMMTAYAPVLAVAIVGTVAFVVARVLKLLVFVVSKFSERTQLVLGSIAAFGAFALLGYMFYDAVANSKNQFSWDEFFKGVGIVTSTMIAVFAVLIFCFWTASTEIAQTFWAFLKAKKAKVCPLVFPPPSFKEVTNDIPNAEVQKL